MAHRRHDEPPAEIALPIVPMLDMSFQLMFFFLATFNPSSVKEGQMDLSLPSKSEAAAKKQEDVKPTAEAHKEDVDIPADFTISLKGYRDPHPKDRGKISSLVVTTNAGDETIEGNREDREAKLRERLLSAKPAPTEGKDGARKTPTVRISAEGNVHWEHIMRIVDVCSKPERPGGDPLYLVSFAKPPDLGASP